MEIASTYDKNVSRATLRTAIGNVLCSYYGYLVKEPMPSRLIDLLRRLDEPDEAYSEK
jgi:Anti-sigma factor NepR